MKKKLVLKYPTLWNMREFIIFGIIFSIIFNITIVFLYFIGLLYILPSLLIVGGIFVLIMNSDLDINSYDVFDKNKVHPYKEYFIYFLIILSFFISTIVLSFYIKNSYATNELKSVNKILFSSTNDINITNFYFEKNTFVYKKNFYDKNERNITKKEKNFLETLNIKDINDLNRIKNIFAMNKHFNFYSLILPLLFVPLILLIRINPKYLSLEMVIYIFVFIIIGWLFCSEKEEFILNLYDFIFKKHYLITFCITIWFVFAFGINFAKYKMQNYFLEKPTNGSSFLFIFSLMILFIILNFSFKLNLWVSSLIIFAIILLFIYPLKQLSVISSFYEDEEKKDK